MTLRRFIGSALLLTAIHTSGFSEELEFTGSFWDTADSFRITINFSQPARLKWDGNSNRYTGQKEEKTDRTSFNFVLTAEEESALRSLRNLLPLCHAGHRISMGTGLSFAVTAWNEGRIESKQHYFNTEAAALFGRRMRDLARSFQLTANPGDFSNEERNDWFKKVIELAEDLTAWNEAIETLDEARINHSPIPWEKLTQTADCAHRSLLHEPTKAEKDFIYETSAVLDAIFEPSAKSKYFPRLANKSVVVTIDEIQNIDSDYYWPFLPPSNLEGGKEEWAFISPGLSLLLEDYINGTGYEYGHGSREGIFRLFRPTEQSKADFQKRLEFVEASNWEQQLPGKKLKSLPIEHVRIAEVAFEDNQSKCVVRSIHDSGYRFTLLTIEDARWKILRQIDSADWQEYRWKEPLFK